MDRLLNKADLLLLNKVDHLPSPDLRLHPPGLVLLRAHSPDHLH